MTAIINTSEEPPFAIKKMEKEIPVTSKNILTSNKSFNAATSNSNGFCIRCGGDLKINLEKPVCYTCYKKVNK